jgi:hypothetical protein
VAGGDGGTGIDLLGALVCVDCVREDLDKVMDSVVLRLQVTVSTDESTRKR